MPFFQRDLDEDLLAWKIDGLPETKQQIFKALYGPTFEWPCHDPSTALRNFLRIEVCPELWYPIIRTNPCSLEVLTSAQTYDRVAGKYESLDLTPALKAQMQEFDEFFPSRQEGENNLCLMGHLDYHVLD